MTEHVTLEERLRSAGDWLGAACVPRWRDSGFVFAGRVEQERLILSGIGGKVEPGETFRAAMLREFREETGCELGPVIAAPPRHLTVEASRTPVPDGAAALIAERPAAHPSGGTLWIAVFLARLTEAPRPVEKVQIFAVVPLASGWPTPGDLRLDDLRAIVGSESRPITALLNASVAEVVAEHTAAAVLATPGLLSEWWEATADPGTCGP